MASIFPPTALNSPKLPATKSLLVKGVYHPSAPIHFCLSIPEGTAILISPSRKSFVSALKEFDDSWLNEYGGHGAVASILTRIKIFYPPSPAHFAVLMSMFHSPRAQDPHADRKTVLDAPPSHFVLHEISGFFLDKEPEYEYTISSYLGLISEALAAVSFLTGSSNCTIALALFDSRLDQLKLPVVRPPSRNYSLAVEDKADDTSLRRFHVETLVRKYFEWIGDVEFTEENLFKMRLSGPGGLEIQWNWVIQKDLGNQGQSNSDREPGMFMFSS